MKLFVRYHFLVIVAICCVFISGQNSYAQSNSKIAFHSTRDGNYEIYTVNPDGMNVTRLTNNSAMDMIPVWSPDGLKIAFSSDRDGNHEIYIMDADGSNQTRLTYDPEVDQDPSWSPDGSKVAFCSRRNGEYDIYIIDSDGTNLTRLTDNPATDLGPEWSPDGSKIAFSSTRVGTYQVFIMNADGSSQINISNHITSNNENPAWSPDGTNIAFYTNRDGNNEIYIMDSDGSAQRRLTYTSALDDHPTWSPDGTKIAFDSNIGSTIEDIEIFVINTDGTGLTNITKNSIFDQTPSWSGLLENVNIISPNGGEDFIIGTEIEISWAINDFNNSIVIEFSFDSGITWSVIANDIASNATPYTWSVPGVESSECLIRILDNIDATVLDISDAPFRIKSLDTVIAELIDDINSDESIDGGLENALTSKLDNALSNLEKDNESSNNLLEAVINQIEALRGKKLTDEQADALIAAVQEIIDINSGVAKPVFAEIVPESFNLKQNFPNPFNPQTTIQYAIPMDYTGMATLKVYDLRGALVKTLVNQSVTQGLYSIVWDGTDDLGNPVSSGIYIYQIKAGSFTKSNRMTFIR